MFSEFRMGPAASGSGLCYSGRVLFRVTKARVKKWENSGSRTHSKIRKHGITPNCSGNFKNIPESVIGIQFQ